MWTPRRRPSYAVYTPSSGGCTPEGSYLTDALSHAPPTTGTFAYNTFKPGAAGFPAVGGSYTDPVFGGVVHRLTDHGGQATDEQIYAHHWLNCDGTRFFANKTTNGMEVRKISDYGVLDANAPTGDFGADVWWDMVNPDIYYFISGTSLMQRNVTTQTSSTKKNFGSTLGNGLSGAQARYLGGSQDMQSGDGRLFVVFYGGSARVWDSQADQLYSGPVASVVDSGYITISPSGKQLIIAENGIDTYTIDRVGSSVSATTKTVWNRCGDHACFVSTSDGHEYGVSLDCQNGPGGMYRFDLTVHAPSEANQIAGRQVLWTWATTWHEFHGTAVSSGIFQDWVFINTERDADTINSGVSGWQRYWCEVMAINTVTLQVRRYCHHRSRGPAQSYYAQPRISTCADGTKVMWMSNYNVGVDAEDAYALFCPLA